MKIIKKRIYPRTVHQPHYKAMYHEKCEVNRNLNKAIDLLNKQIKELKAAPDVATETKSTSPYKYLAALNCACADYLCITVKDKV